jgi:hypothetical protein
MHVENGASDRPAAFVRKVYSILFTQIVATAIVGGFLSQSVAAISWIQQQ